MTIFEKLGMEYEEIDGLFYPVLSVGDGDVTEASVGKYGRMWIGFMKENYPDRYRHLMRIGRIIKTANDVNE
jgi:hypothetical protein